MPELIVDQNGAGQRLDRYLRKVLRAVPVSHLFKMIRTRKVRVNGKRAKAQQVLAVGDKVLLHMPAENFEKDTQRPVRKATSMDFQIRYEDEELLVVSKPPNLPVHPGAGHLDNSLIDQVHAYLEVGPGPAVFRPSLVHRLDKDTSGLVMVGKTIEVVRRLSRMLSDDQVKKSYLALARGVPEPRMGTWDFMVRRKDVPSARRVKTPSRGRKDAVGRTRYRVAITRRVQLSRSETVKMSLLVLRLLTGRTHQIRSHLEQAGFPLAGDRRYGIRELNILLKERYDLRRQFLHAYLLELPHPLSGSPLRITDPYPDDLAALARSLRLGMPKD